jgi:hypothetical protein
MKTIKHVLHYVLFYILSRLLLFYLQILFSTLCTKTLSIYVSPLQGKLGRNFAPIQKKIKIVVVTTLLADVQKERNVELSKGNK